MKKFLALVLKFQTQNIGFGHEKLQGLRSKSQNLILCYKNFMNLFDLIVACIAKYKP